MCTAPQAFAPCLPHCAEKLQQWLSRKEDRVLAMDLSSNIVEHLGENGKSVWPVFMPTMVEALHSQDAAERLESAYVMNLAAPIPSFAELAPTAIQKLCAALGQKAPKKKDLRAKMAVDNAAAALVRLAQHQASSIPAGVDVWGMALAKFPLKDDADEGKKTHKILVDLVLQQHPGALGPNTGNLGRLLSIFAELHAVEAISDKECDAGIEKVFKMLPQDVLKGLASNFSEKQMKKIEAILTK